jgi:radial spoke head protein 9
LIPVGAYKLTPTHELLVNDGFNGLNNTDVNNYASYMHFRQPLTEEKREFIGKLFLK